MGFLSSKFGSLSNFQSLNRHWSVLLDQIPLQFDRDRIKENEMARGLAGYYSKEAIILNISIKGGRLFEGGDLPRHGYFRGNTVYKELLPPGRL